MCKEYGKGRRKTKDSRGEPACKEGMGQRDGPRERMKNIKLLKKGRRDSEEDTFQKFL